MHGGNGIGWFVIAEDLARSSSSAEEESGERAFEVGDGSIESGGEGIDLGRKRSDGF